MKISPGKEPSIASLVMSAWKEYQDNGYPKDPECYVIRANSSNIRELKEIQSSGHYLMSGNNTTKKFIPGRFLWFRLEEDPHLEDEIIFGPELISIDWSSK